MKKRILSILLLCCMVLTLLPTRPLPIRPPRAPRVPSSKLLSTTQAFPKDPRSGTGPFSWQRMMPQEGIPPRTHSRPRSQQRALPTKGSLSAGGIRKQPKAPCPFVEEPPRKPFSSAKCVMLLP